MSVRPRNIELRAERRRVRLFDQIHAPSARFHGRLNDRALFDLRHAGRHTDDHAWLNERKFADFFEELVEHFFGHLVVRNNAVAKRPHGHNIARRSSEHVSGCRADLKHLAGVLIDRHNRRLAQDNSLALFIDQNIRGTKVDTDIS